MWEGENKWGEIYTFALLTCSACRDDNCDQLFYHKQYLRSIGKILLLNL
jgi:hypothetical protein